MLSRTVSVLRNKNKREKQDKMRKRQSLASMQLESAYRAKLYDDMRLVSLMLEDQAVEGIKVTVANNYLSQFMKAIYAEEMSEFSISQIDNTTFEIGRKLINF